MGGKLSLDSTVHKGTCTRFSIPWIAGTDLKDEPWKGRVAGRRILAEGSTQINQRMLDRLVYDVDIPENGRLAVDALTTQRDDATREIPQRHGTQTVIIAMAANALPDDAELCRRAGMDDYLTKPVNTQRLRTVLERWIPVNRFTLV